MGESRAAFDLVGTLVEREKIDCHYEKRGRLVGAYTPKHFAGFEAKAEALNRLCDAGAQLLPRDRLREEMASDFYHGGMTIKRAGKIHPSLYHKGLLDACGRAGVHLWRPHPGGRRHRRTRRVHRLDIQRDGAMRRNDDRDERIYGDR